MEDIDRSVLARRISMRELAEEGLTSLPDIPLESESGSEAGSDGESGEGSFTRDVEERGMDRRKEVQVPATPQSRVLRPMHTQSQSTATSIEATPLARTFKSKPKSAIPSTPAPPTFMRGLGLNTPTASNITAIHLPADASTSSSSSSTGAHWPPRHPSESFEVHDPSLGELATPGPSEAGEFGSGSGARAVVSSTPAVWAGQASSSGASGETVRPTPAPGGPAGRGQVPPLTGRTAYGRVMKPSAAITDLLQLGARRAPAEVSVAEEQEHLAEDTQDRNPADESDPHALGDLYAPNETEGTGEQPHFSGMTMSPGASLHGLEPSGEEGGASGEARDGDEEAYEREEQQEQELDESYEEKVDSFEVPIKANSSGMSSAAASPAPNWVDSRRRHRARTKTPSPETPGAAPRRDDSMGSLGSLRLPDETSPEAEGSGAGSSFEAHEEREEQNSPPAFGQQNRIPSLATDHGSISDESIRTTPEEEEQEQDEYARPPLGRIVPRTPSVYATPSSVKPSLDVVDEGDESEADDGADGAWSQGHSMSGAGVTPARYPQSLSRASIAGRGTSFASSPGMARGHATVDSFHTPGSAFRPLSQMHSQMSPSVAGQQDLSLGDITSALNHGLGSASQASVAETPKAKSIGERAGSALLQSTRKALVQSILDSGAKSVRTSRRSARYSSGSSRTDDGSVIAGASHRSMRLSVGTPHSKAEYDGSSDVSYISVASSSDLTTDRRTTSARFRGNVSEPNIVSAGSGDADGHADAVKIAKHLSGVNKHLESENKSLQGQLNMLAGYLDELGLVKEEGLEVDQQRLGELLDVLMKQQDASEIDAQTDRREDQQQVRELTERVQLLEKALQEKEDDLGRRLAPDAEPGSQTRLEEAERAREEQAAELAKAQELLALTEKSFQERLQKHARDFEEIVNEKDAEIAAAEKASASQLDRLRMGNDALTREKDRLRSVLDSDSHEDKENKLQAQIDGLQRDVRERDAAHQQAVEELASLREQLELAEAQTREERDRGDGFERQVGEKEAALQAILSERDQLRADHRQAVADQQTIEKQLQADLEQSKQAQHEATETIRALKSSIEAHETKIAELEDAFSREERRAADMSREIADAEEEIAKLDEQFDNLRAQLEQEKTAHAATQSALAAVQAESASKEAKRSPSPPKASRPDAVVSTLRKDLAAAAETIERLQNRRSSPSPRQQAEVQAKDGRIEQLEQEKSDLSDRLRSLRVQLDAAQSGQRTPKPFGQSVMTAASPFSSAGPLNKRLLHLQTPKTPGVMKEMSFLNTTMGGDYEEAMIAQVQAVQAELDEAGKKLDANFHRLENAGLRQVSLSDQYVQLCEQKEEVEREVAELQARRLKAYEQLRHIKCPGCKSDFDASDAIFAGEGAEQSLFGNDATPKARPHSSNVLQTTANTLRRQYEDLRAQWQADCEGSSAKIASLQTALNSLSEAKDASEEEFQRMLQTTQENLRMREAELKREKTKADRAAQEQQALWKDEKARLGDEKARLRREITELECDLAIARRSAKSSSEVEHLNKQLREQSAALEAVSSECTELKRQISRKDQELDRAERRWNARTREYEQMKKDLDTLEVQLARHRRDAESFKRDLQAMQGAQGAQRSSDAEVDRLRSTADEADRVIASLQGVIAGLEAELAASGPAVTAKDSGRISPVYLSERKQLTAQIRYLQAKFARENMFRSSLQVQKQYLLCLVGKFKQTEQETLALIASMGYPAERRARSPRYTLKAVATAVLATVRARRAGAEWRHTLAAKARVVKEHARAASRA